MTKIDDAELIDLVAEGATVPEMASILGVTQPAITYRLGKLGLKAAPAIVPTIPTTRAKRPRKPAYTRFSKPASSRRKVRRLCITCLEPFISDGPQPHVHCLQARDGGHDLQPWRSQEMNTATAVHLYIDIETVPSFDPTIIDEIRARHVVAEPDLGAIKPAANLKDEAKIAEDIEKRRAKAMSDWEDAQGKADAAYDEAVRKLCLDATTGHIACASFAIDDGDVYNVQNAALGLFSKPKVIVAGDGSGLSPGDTIRIAPGHQMVVEDERKMLVDLFAKIEAEIQLAAVRVLIDRHTFMTATLTSHGAIASRVAGEQAEFVTESLRYGPLRVVQPVVVAHHAAFDIRYIWQRAIILGVPVPAWWPPDARPWDVDRVDDTMLLWAGANGRIGLDRLCRALGIPGKDGFDGSQVWDAVQRGEIDRVVEYCDDDVRRLRAVHQRIRGLETPAPIAMAAE